MSVEQQMKIQRVKELNPEQLEFIAQARQLGDQIKLLFENIENSQRALVQPTADMRFLAISKTHFQQALMSFNRAVINPDFF